ncbi:alpha/beta fold hydrolase [Ileibacterium valens]|uniref:alpha/beta fold hydrolase n=1 Tax=Ileibacterium valens TaxID=1862668 RepID=UPI00272DA623|nr:alpha/beta hydrolase [Ileibacterium valens]
MELRRKIRSKSDGLPIDIVEVVPEAKEVKGIIQIVHGMAEHKERYLHFMNYLAEQGYACIAHDHRGHGNSVLDPADLGYFYDESGEAIVEDVRDVSKDLRFRYPHVPVFLFGHSMGSLVVRKFAKSYDDEIDGLIICGAVYENPAAKIGLKLVKKMSSLMGGKSHSAIITKLVDGSFDSSIPGEDKNRWISVNKDNIEAFNKDERCGFPFTLNGYQNLLSLVMDVYDNEDWKVKNPELPVFFIAGIDDPVIGSPDEFKKTIHKFAKHGYDHVESKLYPQMRHEILNEINRQQVYDDVLEFMEKNRK